MKRVINFDDEEGYTSGESLSSDEVSHAPPCKKKQINPFLIPRFETELSNAVSYNDLVRFENFLLQSSEELRELEDEFFHVINIALATPGINPRLIDSLFKNGFTVSNHDDYFANSLHIANHRQLSKDIKDLLIQNGATIASLGEDSKYSEDMTNCRNRLLRENCQSNQAEIIGTAQALVDCANSVQEDSRAAEAAPAMLAALQNKDIYSLIASFAGKQSVLGDGMQDDERAKVAYKDAESQIHHSAAAEAVVLSAKNASAPTR